MRSWRGAGLLLAVFLIAGIVASYLMSYDIRELSRIRTGKTAIATIDEINAFHHFGSRGSYYTIEVAYKYTVDGQQYTSSRYSVFSERFPSEADLRAALQDAEIDSFATAHYESGQPGLAVLDTTMRLGSIGFVGVAGMLWCIGLQFFYTQSKRCRPGTEGTPPNTTLTSNEAIVLPPLNQIRSNWLMAATFGSFLSLVVPAIYSFQVPVEEPWIWWIAISPVSIWIVTLVLVLLLTRGDAGAIVLDHQVWTLHIRQCARFSQKPKHSVAYDEILDISAANSGEGGKFGNDFDPLIRYLDDHGAESSFRIRGFRTNRKACEELCAWLRERMAIDVSAESTQ